MWICWILWELNRFWVSYFIMDEYYWDNFVDIYILLLLLFVVLELVMLVLGDNIALYIYPPLLWLFITT